MKTRDFYYDLPEELIAQFPCEQRADSRLLHYNRADQSVHHCHFRNILDLLRPADCLVFNNTKVVPARLYGHKTSGGKVEVLIERLIDTHHALAHIRASKTPKPGTSIELSNNGELSNNERIQHYSLQVEGREGDLFILHSESHPLATIMEQIGHMPLPPYIERADTHNDFSRYQTVYASNPGAVAAPTAGLHFDDDIMQSLTDREISTAFITLHVGAGTFQPVRTQTIEAHQMHTETLSVPAEAVSRCLQAREKGGRIVAVGTTAVRSLEAASQSGMLTAYEGETKIFIYPGYQFKSVDAMLTNFHLPQSTLLMLISAFAGIDNIKHCYQQAIERKYRFFSYGDAMFIS